MDKEKNTPYPTLADRWHADEEVNTEKAVFDFITPLCLSCRLAYIDDPYNCRIHTPIPRNILIGDEECADYQKKVTL